MNTMKKTILASSVALAMGAPVANAALVTDLFGAYDWSTESANFTMLSGAGFNVGGTNDVQMTWDGNAFNASSDYTGPGSVGNVTAASTTKFFDYNWTAHDIQVFTPGSYSFDTALAGGNPEAGILNATVNTGQLGIHMLFDWNGNLNIDVFVVADPNSVFGPGIARSSSFDLSTFEFGCDSTVQNCLWDGATIGPAGKPTGSQVWMLASGDANGDGIMGIPMATGGPFAGFNANFNATMTPTPDAVIPVPAAAWLFGSGLLGLVGIARRKKSS